MNTQSKYNKSFTMIEMLAVITIMAILVVAAIPGWKSFVQNNQAASIASKLYAALTLARNNAIQSGNNVIICPISQPSGTTCQNITQWDGWVLFIDKNANSALDAGGTELVKYFRDQPAGIVTSTTTGSITFYASGFANTTKTFNIIPVGCIGSNGRQITVAPSGNIQMDHVACP